MQTESEQDVENIYDKFKEKLNHAHITISDPKSFKKIKAYKVAKDYINLIMLISSILS